MNKLQIITATTLVLASTLATASPMKFYDSAKVVNVKEIYKNIYTDVARTTETNCRYVETQGDFNLGGALLGGIIGNQFGGGDGKKALTAMGALIGANSDRGSQVKKVCDKEVVRQASEVFSHYKVSYKYHGKISSYNTTNYPSDRIKLRIRITPIDEAKVYN